MKSFSLDLRERVVTAYEKGEGTQKEIARRFGVSEPFVKKMLKQYRTTGSLMPLAGRGRKPAIRGKKVAVLEAFVEGRPDATLEEIRKHLRVSCSIVAVSNALKRLGYRRKKSPSRPASRAGRT